MQEMISILTRKLKGADPCWVSFPNLSRLHKSLLVFSVVCMLVAFSAKLPAQSITSGDVTGTVTDPTGAAIPGATVTLTNVNTNTSQQATTNNDGSYRFAFVPPGAYKVNV